MKKTTRLSYLFMIFLLFFSIAACGGGSVTGKYYQYDGETKIEESWFELKNGSKWVDNDGLEGRFEIKGDKITLYSELFGEEEELMSGTIKDGVLTFTTLGMTQIYKKDGATGSVDLPPFYSENKDYLAQESKSYTVSYLSISNGMVSSMNYSTFSEELYLRVPHDTSTITLADYISSSRRWDLCEDKEGKQQISNTVLTINPGQRKVYYIFLPEESKSIKLTIERKSTFLVSYYDQDGEFIITHHYRKDSYLSVPKVNYEAVPGYSEYKWAYYDSGSYRVIDDPSHFTPSDGLKVKVLPLADEYNVTLNPDGGELGTSSKMIKYNTYLDLPIPVKEGHTFLGWYKDEVRYTDDQGQGLSPWRDTAGGTLTAKYSVNVYDVSLYINNEKAGVVSIGTGGTTASMAYGSTVTVVAQTTTDNNLKDEYIFLGWFDTDSCLSESFEYTFIMPATSVNLEARWSTKQYTITYYLFGGTNGQDNPEVYTVEDEIVLSDPSKSGNTFGGWYENEDFTGESVSSIPLGSKGNKVLYAKWFGADEATQGLSYYLTDEGYLVSAGNITEDDVVIPEAYSGKPVVGIDSYGFFNSNIKSIILPETIKSIGQSAFRGCSNLTSIVVPDSVETIGSSAFGGCPLQSIVLPFVGASLDASDNEALFGYIFGNISYEGSYAARQYYGPLSYVTYYLPESLKTVTITGGNFNYGSFYACSGIETINIPATVYRIDEYTFYDCFGLKNIYVDDANTSFTDIDGVLFNKAATVLRQYPLGRAGNYTVPAGVTEIRNSAFKNSTALTAIAFPETLLHIGNSAFMGCTSLAAITLPQDLQDIGTYAFSGCESLETVNLNSNLITIGNNAFTNCTKLAKIVVPASVTSIGSEVFSGCSSLNEITLPFVGSSRIASQSNSLFGYIFGSSSYEGSYQAQQFSYFNPNYIPASNYSFFYIPSSLKTVRITGGIINYGAFFNCTNVETIILGAVTKVEDYAFTYCHGIKEIEFPSSVTSFGSGIFYGCQNVESLTLPFIDARFSTTFGSKVQTTIKNIIITGGTSVPEYAFSGCTNLEKVVIPNSVTSIGRQAFSACGNLKEITLPFVGARANATNDMALFGYIFGSSSFTGSVAVQQYYADDRSTTFYLPASLTKVVITGGPIGYGAFLNCNMLTSVTLPEGLTSIGTKAFYYCTSLKTLSIPESVTYIGNDALYGCNALQYTIYEGLKYLGNWLFDTVGTDLTTVSFKDNTVGIYDLAFANCTKITSLDVPDSVVYIGKGAFSGCTGLTEITLPFVGESKTGNNEHFGYVFGAVSYTNNATSVPASLKKVVITGGTKIAGNAFYGCKNITSVSISNTVTTIGYSAFAGCGGLTDMTLPFVGSGKIQDSVGLLGYIFGTTYYEGGTSTEQFYTTYGSVIYYIPTNLRNLVITGGSIGYGAFYGCRYLVSVTLPAGLTAIGDKAFNYCESLTSIAIPETVTTIGGSAFIGCARLQTINIPESSVLTTVGSSAFRDCTALEAIYIPAGVTRLEDYTFSGCRNLVMVTFGANSQLNYIGPYAFNNCTVLETINVPAGVTRISENAFYNCPKLVYEIYDGKVKYLSNWVFGVVDKTLSTVTLKPQTVGIYNSAFANCTNLTTIDIPAEVVIIANYAFSGCTNLQSVRFAEDSKLQYLYEYAFNNCRSLEEINLEANAELKTISAYLFNNCSSLAAITIPTGVTTIGEYAFSGCANLSEVTIPATVTTINNDVFNNCLSLTSLVIPDSVTSIGANVLRGCGSLTELTLPFVGTDREVSGTNSALFGYIFGNTTYTNSISVNQYYAKDKSASFFIPAGLKTVEITGSKLNYGAFYNCSMIENFIMSNMVSIGEAAFYNCSGLVAITIPATTTEIGSNAFANCANLVYFFSNNPTPPTMTSAFTNYASGLKIYVPAGSVSSYKAKSGWIQYHSLIYSQAIIDSDGFAVNEGALIQYLGALADVVIPDTVTSIKAYAFRNTLESVTANTVVTIENNAFRNCLNLENVSFGEGLVKIGEYAFAGCLALESITIPASVTNIGSYAFSGNPNLKEVRFAANSQLTRIEQRAFLECTGLESITLPENLDYVNYYAFKLCPNLRSVYIKARNLTLEIDSFEKTSSLKFYVPADSVASYQASPSWKNYASNVYSESIIDANGFAIQDNVLIQYCGSLTEVRIPETVSAIGAYAFNHHTTSVTIPASVTAIHDYAFKNCVNLESVVFEENSGLESLGKYAFADCTSLTSINLPASLTTIATYAFSGCTALTEISIPAGVTELSDYLFSGCTELTTVLLQDGLSGIGAYAFNNCRALQNIVIPASVTSIASHAFSGCSGLTEMTLPFVGASAQSTSANALFGYIFGTTAYTGATAVTQVYGDTVNPVYYIPSGLRKVTLIGGALNYGAFSNCAMLREVIINNVTAIGSSAFSGCSGLVNVTIPTTVKKIGSNAFAGCSSLLTITLPSSITGIEDSAFNNCTDLAIVFLNSTTPPTLGTGVFANNAASRKFYVPSAQVSAYKNATGWAGYASLVYSKTLINSDGFAIQAGKLLQYTGSLTNVVVPNTVTIIGNYAFHHLVERVEIPSTVVTIESYAFRACRNLQEIVVATDNSAFSSPDGVLFNKEGTNLITYPQAKTATQYVIPDGIRNIESYAFLNNTYLRSLTIPSGLTEIQANAFYYLTALTSIAIPSTVTKIYMPVFVGCSGLTEITLPFLGDSKTTPDVLGIFFGTTSYPGSTSISQRGGNGITRTYYLPSGLKKVTVNGGTIGYGAFYNCSLLNEINLNGVTDIGELAFYYCSNFTLRVYNTTPPTLASNALYYSYTFTIYVPSSSVYQYRTRDVWKNYTNNIYGM
jgi:uncharacterized repeat protein (TIGR02543 family)